MSEPKPHSPLPRPAHRVTVNLGGKRWAIDIATKELPDKPAKVIPITPPPPPESPDR